MTEREFKEAKLAALEKVMPYFMAPDRFSLPKMTLEETALLMSKGPDGIMSKSVVSKLEKTALLKLKDRFAKLGVISLEDLL